MLFWLLCACGDKTSQDSGSSTADSGMEQISDIDGDGFSQRQEKRRNKNIGTFR